MGAISYYPGLGPIKSIQVVSVAITLTALATTTTTATITSVDTDKTIVLPSTMLANVGGAGNLICVRASLTDSTTLSIAVENDTSTTPSGITVLITVVEFNKE